MAQQDMYEVLDALAGRLKSTATVVVMCKDHIQLVDNQLQCASHLVFDRLKVTTAVLMGGNVVIRATQVRA